MKRKFFLLTSLCCLTAAIGHAQIANGTALQLYANFNIDGFGMAQRFISSNTTSSTGSAHYVLTQNTANRWVLGTAAVENGVAKQGSDFALYAYDGNTTLLGRYLTIMRSNAFMGINTAAPDA